MLRDRRLGSCGLLTIFFQRIKTIIAPGLKYDGSSFVVSVLDDGKSDRLGFMGRNSGGFLLFIRKKEMGDEDCNQLPSRSSVTVLWPLGVAAVETVNSCWKLHATGRATRAGLMRIRYLCEDFDRLWYKTTLS